MGFWTITAKMMFYKDIKPIVRSSDGDSDFFDIVAKVLQGITLAPFLYRICLDTYYGRRLIKQKKMVSD